MRYEVVFVNGDVQVRRGSSYEEIGWNFCIYGEEGGLENVSILPKANVLILTEWAEEDPE